MAQANRRFSESVREALDAGGYEYRVEPTVGGTTPDFVVELPNGQAVILEAKAWSPTPSNIERAQHQAAWYRDELGAVSALVVVPRLTPRDDGEGVVGIARLADRLAELARHRHKSSRSPEPIETPKAELFCAMPFQRKFDDVFLVAMTAAARFNDLTARRVDKEMYVGNSIDQLHSMIKRCAVVVADLSGSRPDVLYEAGFAHGLGKPVVYICSSGLAKTPYDVRQQAIIKYGVGQTAALTRPLRERVGAALLI